MFNILSAALLFVSTIVTGPVEVKTPVGTAPSLPWQIMVTGEDGGREWRQVRWDNADLDFEKALADPAQYPVGSKYVIEGEILGDGTKVEAEVTVTAEPRRVPAAKPLARPLPLGDVSLTGANRLTSNRDHDVEAILSWDVKQQLYNYRDTYGLSTEGYPVSDGWDSPVTKLKGHGSGHYMSALALAYAGEKDPARKEALLQNIRTMVDALRECQERTFVWSDSLGRYWEARDLAPEEELRGLKGDWAAFDEYKKDWAHYGYGYLNAIPAQHAVLVEMYRPYHNEKWVWAPYYSIHKQLAGLIEIALNVDDKEVADKAFLIARDMGLWVWNRLHYRTFVQSEGTVEERRERPGNRYEMWNMYIAGEVGGMEESLSRLSEMASDPEDSARLLEAARCFNSPAFFDPLSVGVDDIRTRHANQHIPMITGALRSYRIDGEPYYYNIASNFWDLLQGRYIYATGGVGNSEMFRQPYTQTASMNSNAWRDREGVSHPDPDINETCCSYNLAKLTRDLNCYNPDDARYMDYYERVLSNHLVGSTDPDHFDVTYHYAVGLDAVKHFGNDTPQSSCCGGTGSENHVKYQEAAYFVSDNTLWVALYMPTEAVWREKGVTLEQECQWPAEKSVIKVKEGSGRFALKLRVPSWAVKGFEVKVNGRKKRLACTPGSYVQVRRRHWKAGDTVEVSMPFAPHIYYSPDKMERDERWIGALMYGPLVMATGDVHTWDEAAVDLHRDLREVVPSMEDGVYTLRVGDKVFKPDYWQTGHETHYLRIGFIDERQTADSIDGDWFQFDIKRPVADKLTEVHSRKFGMDPGLEDNTEAFGQALDYCRRNPGTRLVIDKGVYRFAESSKIRMQDLQTCFIDGTQAKFIFAQAGTFLTINHCNCLEINGLTIDVDRVANPVDDVFRVANANPSDHTLDFVFFRKEEVSEDMLIKAITQCDPETLTFGAKISSKEHYVYANPAMIKSVEKTAPNVLKVTHSGAFDRYEDGDTFIMRHHVYDGCVFSIGGETANLTFDGVKIYGSYGSGYAVGDLANHYQIINSTIGVDPEDKTGARVSQGADGIHIAGSGGYFYLAGCDIWGQGDDALNVHDGIGYVYSVEGNKLKMYSTQTRLNVGEALAFKDTKFNDLGFSATITSFEQADDSRTGKVVIFDKDISAVVKPGCIAYSTVTDSGNYVIRGNYFHENRARALLLQSDNGVCEDNVFYKVEGQVIKIVMDIITTHWMEGTGVQHLVVRNNVFDTCDYSGWGEQITIDTNIDGHRAECCVFRDINITGNEFKNFPGLVLNAMNVDGLKFTGNKIDKPECILLQSYCENTDIEGNDFDAGI